MEMKNVHLCTVNVCAMFRRAEKIQFHNFFSYENSTRAFNSGKGGRRPRSYPAVFTALSVGAYGISFQGACGGIAAWIHTFLELEQNKTK